jgi:5'-3' exonuclease
MSVDAVHAIATDYAATLAWSAAYLTRGECLSQGWAYPHVRAPTALDLHLALLAPPSAVAGAASAAFEAADRAHAQYRTNRALRGTTDPAASWQLMQVLPPRSAARLLEAPALALAKSSALSHLYPATFSVCTYLCERLHECPALLPAWSGEYL